MRAGVFILALDGFDELDPAIRSDIEFQILNIRDAFPNTVVLIASRPDQRFNSWQSFFIYKVDQLSLKQCLDLVKSLEYDGGVKKRFAREVKARLFTSHGSFLSNPLLVTIMLITFENFAAIPQKMHAFYGLAFDALFQRHDAQKEQFKRKNHSGLSREDFKLVFAAFSAMSYLENIFSFDDERLKLFSDKAIDFVRELGRKSLEGVTSDSVISDMKESVCMLIQDGLNTIFVHRSFQEYFSAVFATSVHGSRVKRILDGFVRHRGSIDSALFMAFDLDQETVESEWVLPLINEIETELKLNEAGANLGERMAVCFRSLAIGKDGDPVFAEFEGHFSSKLHAMALLYNEVFRKPGGMLPPVGLNLKKFSHILTDEKNRNKYRAQDVVDELPNLDDVRRAIRIEFSREDDWWLRALEVDKQFDILRSNLKAIKEDILARKARRDAILGAFA